MVQYSILIADGDPNVAQRFSGLLRTNGFNAASSTSGLEALKLYKSESPDLVVTDLALSEMDGMALLEELKRFDPNSRVLVTTANADKNIITRAFRLGALDILEKPLDPEFLITKIRDLLAKEDRALEGNLQMMSLASIVQINCEERNRAQLSVNHQGKVGTIFFKDGEMVHAEVGNLVGDEAIYSLLSWEEGSFELKMGVEPATTTISKNWSGLLLEGMRRIDESTAAWSSEWEEETFPTEVEPQNQLQERIIKAIISNRDVTSAVICTTAGTLLAQEKDNDPESAIKLGVQLLEEADNMGGYFDGGDVQRIVLTGSENRFYIQQQENDLLILSLDKRSSAETVNASVQTIYKRYQSA